MVIQEFKYIQELNAAIKDIDSKIESLKEKGDNENVKLLSERKKGIQQALKLANLQFTMSFG